jgi:hypothetical protein
MLKGEFSEMYMKYASSVHAPQDKLTNTQHRFAEYLLTEEGIKILGSVGELDSIYLSIRKFIKTNKL